MSFEPGDSVIWFPPQLDGLARTATMKGHDSQGLAVIRIHQPVIPLHCAGDIVAVPEDELELDEVY